MNSNEKKSKDLIKESMDRASNLAIANNLMDLVLKTFTADTFNFYDYSKLIFIQVMALVNEGLITEERAVEIEAEIKLLLNSLLGSTATIGKELAKVRKGKK